jgi:hypothetical protein
MMYLDVWATRFSRTNRLFANQPRKVWWTNLEVISPIMWLIKPKKKYNNYQYYADKPFGGTFQKTVLLDENKEHYVCALSSGRRFWIGLFAVVHFTLQIHPRWKLLVYKVSSGHADKEERGQVPWLEGVRPLLHMDQANHSSPTQWLPLHSTWNTTAHF